MIVSQEVTAAMKLQDLYYGNVIPCQHDVRKDSDYAKTKSGAAGDVRHTGETTVG